MPTRASSRIHWRGLPLPPARPAPPLENGTGRLRGVSLRGRTSGLLLPAAFPDRSTRRLDILRARAIALHGFGLAPPQRGLGNEAGNRACSHPLYPRNADPVPCGMERRAAQGGAFTSARLYRAAAAFFAAGLLFSGISLILKKASESNSNSLSEQTAALCRVSLPSFDFV